MTIICWKSPYLASDSRIVESSDITSDNVQKIFKLKNGSLIGLAGDVNFQEVTDLFNRQKLGKLPTTKQLIGIGVDFRSIYVRFDGTVFDILASFDSGRWGAQVIEIKEPYYAVGSGSAYALGALAAGATASQAVKITCRHDNNCGGKVQNVKLDIQQKEEQ